MTTFLFLDKVLFKFHPIVIWYCNKGLYALCLHEQLKWSKVEVGPLGVLVTWSATSHLPEHWMQPSPGKLFKFDFSLVSLSIPSLLHAFSHHIFSQCQHVCPFTQMHSDMEVHLITETLTLARPDQLSFSWKISVTGGPQRAPLWILQVMSLSNRSLE